MTTKHIWSETCIKVIDGERTPERDNLGYVHTEVKDATEDFYSWLKETNTPTKWFDEFLEKHLKLIDGFNVPSDVIISRDDKELRFYCPLNVWKRPDVIFDLCTKGNVPEEYGMLFNTPDQVLGVGIKCKIGSGDLNWKIYRALNIDDYNNQIWWNSTPLKAFSWPEGLQTMILDFDATGVSLLIPGAIGLPEDIEMPKALTEMYEILNISDVDPRQVRWIAFYLKDLQELIANHKPITNFNYYLIKQN